MATNAAKHTASNIDTSLSMQAFLKENKVINEISKGV